MKRKPDQPDSNRSDSTRSQATSAVRRGNKDDALYQRICVKYQSSLHARIVRNLRVEHLGPLTEDFVPDRSSRFGNLHSREQAAHAVAYQNNAVLQAEPLLCEGEVFLKSQCGKGDWVAGRVGKCPKLVVSPNFRILQKSENGSSPDER